jgi:hypothetical protein
MTNLFNLANKIVDEDISSNETRLAVNKLINGLNKKTDDFYTSIRTGTTYEEAATQAKDIRLSAQEGLSAVNFIKTDKDTEEYVSIIKNFLEAINDGYGNIVLNLNAHNATELVNNMKNMNSTTDSFNKKIKKDIDKFLKSSALSKNFNEFESKSTNLSSYLNQL